MRDVLELLDIEELLLLKRIIELDKYGTGVDVRELGYRKNDNTIQKLLKLGVIYVSFHSRSYFCVRVNSNIIKDIDDILKYKIKDITEEDIDRVLSEIYNYEDIKKKIKNAIKYKLAILLIGPPATGKSEILRRLAKLPKTTLLSGISLKKEQVYTVMERVLKGLIEVVLIDELDKVHVSVIDALNDLYDQLVRAGRGSIIATANTLHRLPEYILSRFYTVEVGLIDENTAVEIIRKELELRGIYNIDSNYIKEVYRRVKDIRRAVSEILLSL